MPGKCNIPMQISLQQPDQNKENHILFTGTHTPFTDCIITTALLWPQSDFLVHYKAHDFHSFLFSGRKKKKTVTKVLVMPSGCWQKISVINYSGCQNLFGCYFHYLFWIFLAFISRQQILLYFLLNKLKTLPFFNFPNRKANKFFLSLGLA